MDAPPQFQDTAGRTWRLALDVGLVRHVRQVCDVDLVDWGGSPGDTAAAVPPPLRLASDPCLLVDVLWLLCEEQARAKEIDDVAFGRGMAGDAIADAVDALLQAIIAFFPSRKRSPLQKAMTRLRQLEDRAVGMANEALDDPTLLESLNGTSGG